MQMPMLDDLFFAVCQTAIKNCAWKYSDFEAVKRAEGQLDMLRTAMLASQLSPEAIKPAKPEASEPKTINEPAKEPAPQPEPPVASKEASDSKLISPSAAKTAPTRPMPDEILAAVQDGIELAKNPPKVANVKVESLSSDPAEAEMQFKKPF